MGGPRGQSWQKFGADAAAESRYPGRFPLERPPYRGDQKGPGASRTAQVASPNAEERGDEEHKTVASPNAEERGDEEHKTVQARYRVPLVLFDCTIHSQNTG